MKVDLKRLEALQPYDGPEIEPGCIERIQEKLKDLNVPKLTAWQKEGLAATACIGAVCLTVTVAGTHLAPPGTGPGRHGIMPDTEIVQMASIPDVPDVHMEGEDIQDVKVTHMAIMGQDNTAEVFKLNATARLATDVVDEIIVDEQTIEDATEVALIDAFTVDESVSEPIETSMDEESAEYSEDPDLEKSTEDSDQEESATEQETESVSEQSEESNEAQSEEQEDDKQTVSGNSIHDGSEEESESVDDEPVLVVANVDTVLNVRAEASTESEKVGVMYKDCGGTVLEQKDGWTKIESGRLVGWAMDDYLIFDEEAQARADAVGETVATVEASTLRIRQEPNTDADVLANLKEHETIDVKSITDDGWAEVTINQKIGYVSTDHVRMSSKPKAGETVEEIKEREAAQKKAALENARKNATNVNVELTVNAGYEGTASDLEMLATIIYCEAGNQPYEGKVAVGNVVLNRVNNGRFPGTINEVLRAPWQFSPVGSGKYDRVLGSGQVPASCYQAAQDAMSGVCYVGNCLYFKNPRIAGAHAGIIIGDHVFW